MSRPRTMVVGWVLAVLAIASFTSLGVWQSRRAIEKQAMLDASARVLALRDPVSSAQAFAPARARDYDWYVTRGGFAARAPMLLDNQMRDGRVGVRVYRVFYPDDGGELLVDLGWLPVAGDRALPRIAPADPRPMELRGLLAPPPSPGLILGEAMILSGHAWLMTRIDMPSVKRTVGNPGLPLAPRVLRLDPALPLGFDRDLQLLANTLPPDKHRGYALQWYALALTVLATALILTFRRPRR